MSECISQILSNHRHLCQTDRVWDELTCDFESLYTEMPTKYMARKELSFHTFVKILGPLCISIEGLPGDIVEIGVWKGKSLALMERLSPPHSKIIGIDPCSLEGQSQELDYFHKRLFPRATIIKRHSQLAISEVLKITREFKILHIDGGHAAENVWMDFLIYERFVVTGGFVIFDDYADDEFSPEVGPAVDNMLDFGLFHKYAVIGPVENSYILLRRH